jgi:predicted metal-dependent hydrolase
MDAHWKFLETHADREEIQAEIRREIRKGTIRVVPGPRGISIIPLVWDSAHEKEAILRPNKLRVRSSLRWAEG